MFYSLPIETKLDIFKFFSYKELCSIKQKNLYFYDFINSFEGELAREELFEISIVTFLMNLIFKSFTLKMRYKQVPDEAIKPNAKNFNFALFDKQHGEFNEQIEEKVK